MRFENKVIIVTGGARGIGKAIAAGFAREGGKVIIADILEDEGAGTVKEITREGGRAFFLKTDVTRKGDVLSTVNRCLEQFGKIDVLVNNVGWDRLVPFKDTDEEFWDKIIDINYKSVLRFCKAVIEPMMQARYGKIVSISSDAAKVGGTGNSIYAGCKAGVIGFSKTLARETAGYGLNVNCVCPGITDTPLIQELRKKESGRKMLDEVEKAVPLGRMGKPEDIAATVLFLASDEAQFVTGQSWSVSGGQTMI